MVRTIYLNIDYSYIIVFEPIKFFIYFFIYIFIVGIKTLSIPIECSRMQNKTNKPNKIVFFPTQMTDKVGW